MTPEHLHVLSQDRSGLIPLSVKVAHTLFVAVLVPFYWWFHGPANFLWFCNIALFATVAALWLENRFLASMQLVAVFVLSLAWQVDFALGLVLASWPTPMTHYMFRDDIPLVIRGLSLYHLWFPYFLWWLVGRLGYDRRAWLALTAVTWVDLPLCFYFTKPEKNINAVFGTGSSPQTWMQGELYLALMMLFYPLCVWLPSHLLFRWVFRRSPEMAIHPR